MCHMSHVTCHMSLVTFFFYKVVELLGGRSFINGDYPVLKKKTSHIIVYNSYLVIQARQEFTEELTLNCKKSKLKDQNSQ